MTTNLLQVTPPALITLASLMGTEFDYVMRALDGIYNCCLLFCFNCCVYMCTCIDIIWWVGNFWYSQCVGYMSFRKGREGNTHTHKCGNVEVEILNLGMDK